MKRLFTTMLISMLTCVGLMAQLNIWHNGSIVYQRDYTQIDSITFAIQGTDTTNVPTLPNGMYIVGAATGYADMQAGGIDCQMANGINEVTYEPRAGMYEKYIALEANQPFQLILHESGTTDITYGANLVLSDAYTDFGYTTAYKGGLIQNASMQVPQSGLYHVVVDLNNDGLLDAAGGAQVMIAPVSWGIAGSMNGWNVTLGQKVADAYTWSWEGVEIFAGYEFKFRDEHGWKIFLDSGEQVAVGTNLGVNMVPNAGNFRVDERGIYTITLTWELAAGDIKNSYSYELVKTSELVFDPSTFVVGISGSINNWSDPSDAFIANLIEANVTDNATKAGMYVYKLEDVTFPADSEFKFRFNGNWLGVYEVWLEGVNNTGSDNFGGIVGTYDIVIRVVWDGDYATSITAAFTESEQTVERIGINLSAIVPAGWEHCYVWAWDAIGNIFQNWPGMDLTINNGMADYTFIQVVAPLNVLFSNGDGVQTPDIYNVQNGDVIDIQAYLPQ